MITVSHEVASCLMRLGVGHSTVIYFISFKFWPRFIYPNTMAGSVSGGKRRKKGGSKKKKSHKKR
jgi:hypothetical protein